MVATGDESDYFLSLSLSIIDDELYQESCCTFVTVLSVWAYQYKQMIDLIISIRYEHYDI